MKNVLGFIALFLFGGSANAGFIGNTLDADYLFGGISSVYDDMSNVVVGAGAEWSLFNLSTDVDDKSITMSRSGGVSFSQSTFNGFSFTDVNGTIEDFVAVTVDASTTLVGFDASRVSFTADSLYLNFEGLSGGDLFAKVNVSFTSAVPEPSIIALFGLGLVGIGFARRRQS
jgi:hypothetical protein